MHILVTGDSNLPLVFNVDQPVGEGCPNRPDDVLLVQFLIKRAAEKGTMAGKQDQKRRMLAVPQTGYCDAATVDGIRAVQEYLQNKGGATPDGRITPSSSTTRFGNHVFTIGNLNSTVRHHHPDEWPRLQDIDGCPSGIKERIKTLL